MAFDGDGVSTEVKVLGLLEDILIELRKINVYNNEAMGFDVPVADLEE